MASEGADVGPAEEAVEAAPRRYAVGMEVPLPERARPSTTPDPTPWQPDYGVRFSPRVRWVITAALLGPALFVLLVAARVLIVGQGPLRAGGVVVLFPLVIATPLVWLAVRDLWFQRR